MVRKSKSETVSDSNSESKQIDPKKSKSRSKSSSKSRSSKQKRSAKKELPIIPETPPEPEPEIDVSDVEDEANVDLDGDPCPVVKKKRVPPTRDSVLLLIDDLILSVEGEITRLRESAVKCKGVKFLRSLNKRVKSLRSQSARVMKQRKRVTRKNNNNSGFLKPVVISPEMAEFTGWDPEEMKSRVAVTKFICKYIKDNDLQNPDDRRKIVADEKLSNLLNYDKDRDEPLTYYRLQTHMKTHFTKPVVSE
jgi:chromatin remodeling complex protein RSC6